MRKFLVSIAVIILPLAIVLLAAQPVAAITAELAKKCRAMAIKAHPPAPPGTGSYAQAERDFYRDCIAKNGVMPDNGSAKTQPPKSN